MPPGAPIKRSSSQLDQLDALPDSTPKRPYHHHHQLHHPVTQALPEPAITDDVCVDHLLYRTISHYLLAAGFDIADPAAMDAFRNAAEEYLLHFTSFVRQSMLASRRTQPIPHDFELALKKQRICVDDLIPLATCNSKPNSKSTTLAVPSIPTLPLSPPPDITQDTPFKDLPSLGPQLSGHDDRARSAYIPAHFPEFPSKHTYRSTPVFTHREQDPQRLRERATEDGRHGEEALRKLARAAFTDNVLGSAGRDRKPWGKRAESMDGMFEKTAKSVAKKMQKAAGPSMSGPATGAVEIESGASADPEVKMSRNKLGLNVELPPVINCERDFWRRSAMGRRVEGEQVG